MQAFFVLRKRAKCFLSCSLDRVHLIYSHDSLTYLLRSEKINPSPFFLLVCGEQSPQD